MPTTVQTDWISPAQAITGRDHLAVQAVSEHLYAGLLPGLTNVTDRARCYAFLHPDPETEAIGMQAVFEYERSQGRQVDDVHEKNLAYDVTSLDTSSGELRLIKIKGLAGETGTVALTPNEKRVAENPRDCYWLYVVTRCKQPDGPQVMLIDDPARLSWHEVRKVEHCRLSVDALRAQPGGGTGA